MLTKLDETAPRKRVVRPSKALSDNVPDAEALHVHSGLEHVHPELGHHVYEHTHDGGFEHTHLDHVPEEER